MDGSKLSLFMFFMVSAVAARLIPNGDVDKKHNSDDQERLDRQDYSQRRILPIPSILDTGICAKSPSLPCCKQTIEVYYEMMMKPGEIMDLSYPNCRTDGYYAAKQCNWAACFCVDPNGNSVEVTTQRPKYAWYYNNFNIICPDLDLGSYEYEVEPADQLLTSQEISNLPDLPHEEDPENTGKTIDELIGGAHNGANHKRLERPIDAETKNTMEHANGDGKQGKSLKPGHQRAAHGCVQWGEPCTVGKTNCCGDSNYDGTCEWRIGTLFKYACGVKSGFPIKLD